MSTRPTTIIFALSLAFAPIAAIAAIAAPGCALDASAPAPTAHRGKLSLTVRDEARVAGTYERDGLVISFESARVDGVRFTSIRTAVGAPLLEVRTGRDDGYAATLLGTKIESTRDGGGAADALAAARRLPEYALIADLASELQRLHTSDASEASDLRTAAPPLSRVRRTCLTCGDAPTPPDSVPGGGAPGSGASCDWVKALACSTGIVACAVAGGGTPVVVTCLVAAGFGSCVDCL